MGNQKRARHNHVLQKITRKWAKSWKKYDKAILWYIDLLKKQSKYWQTKWIEKTMTKSVARLRKYWISTSAINKRLESKWLNDLIINDK